MNEPVLPCNATIHLEATGSEVKGKVSKDQILYMPMDDPSPSIVHPTRLSIHTYPPQLNQPFALVLPPTLEELIVSSPGLLL